MSLKNLIDTQTVLKVSSTAPQSTKKSLLRGSSEECWTSTSLPAFIHLIFPKPLSRATHLAITFQGGFVGTTTTVYVATKRPGDESGVELGLTMGGRVFPADKNGRQVFKIPYPQALTARPTSPIPNTTSSPIIQVERPPNPLGNGEPAPLLTDAEESGEPDELVEIKLEFEKSSDDYGRVTVYQVEVLG